MKNKFSILNKMKALAPLLESQCSSSGLYPFLFAKVKYLCKDVSRYPCSHEDGAQLLQQTTLVHGLLTAGSSSW